MLGGVSGQTFYDQYSKGQKSQKKERWEEAIQSYQDALKLRSDDGERIRTYGVNFIDYFPNRELGIVYFELEDFGNARIYLEKSQQNQTSERATYYLSRLPQSSLADQTVEKTSTQAAITESGKNEKETVDTEKVAEMSAGNEKDPGNESVAGPSGEVIVQTAAVVSTAPKDNTKPLIIVTSPPLLNFRSLNPVTNDVKKITISGKVTDQSGIYEVLVNGNDASITSEGDFHADAYLSVGDNNIIIRATDIHQNTQVREFTIVRQDMAVAKNVLMDEGGKYYALIIGVSDYTDPKITDLDGLPVRDANLLTRTLMERYTFEKENVLLLENPTRTHILRAFDYLTNTITPVDNLLIFYAGHGYYDEKTELGYWLPADAEANFTANWIYNDVLVANLKRIQSKHTLLISDACFSGSIFKTRALVKDAPQAYQKKYELASRKAITSGVLKTVPNKSVFLKYLSDRLENNEEVFLSASQLFQSVEIPVANNSPNTPQYGDIQNVGDEGGDFIFIRR